MKKQLRDLWVAALRSGNYRQGTGNLRAWTPHGTGTDREHFCCLGVLSDIVIEREETNASWLVDEVVPWIWLYYEDVAGNPERDDEMLCPNLQREVGIDQKLAEQLANLNDGGASFEEIANGLDALPNMEPLNALIGKYSHAPTLRVDDIRSWLEDAG
jgi:hypothetical protein